MNCPHCSREIQDWLATCPHCKNPVGDGAAKAPLAEAAAAAPAAAGAGPMAAAAAVPDSQKETPGLAIAGLILAFIPCLFINVVGGVLGIVALNKIGGEPNKYKGRGLAIAAIVIGFGWFVITLIGVIAAVAIPNYLQFQARAKQSEAKVSLKGAYVAQQAYLAEHGKYAVTFEEMGWQPDPGHQYSYFMGAEAIQSAQGPFAGEVARSYVEPEAFQIIAVGNIDTDEALDVWSINEQNTLENVQNDVTSYGNYEAEGSYDDLEDFD